MSVGGGDDWGEEVMGGVFMMKRGSHIGHQAQLTRMAQAAGLTVEFNFEKIYEDIEAMRDLIRRLETSNQLMREYLRDELEASRAQEDTAGELATLESRGTDVEVTDAIAENELIIKQKKTELQELLSLVSMHKCGHEHGACHGGDHGHVGEILQEDMEGDDDGDDSENTDSSDDAPFEEGGQTDNTEVMCLAQMSAHANRHSTFQL